MMSEPAQPSNWRTTEHDAENCPGCRPVVVDQTTGKILPESHPTQRAAVRAWRNALPAQRTAWHRVTCLNSQNPIDLAMAQAIVDRIAET